jgi:hypothetical protein
LGGPAFEETGRPIEAGSRIDEVIQSLGRDGELGRRSFRKDVSQQFMHWRRGLGLPWPRAERRPAGRLDSRSLVEEDAGHLQPAHSVDHRVLPPHEDGGPVATQAFDGMGLPERAGGIEPFGVKAPG